MKTPMLRRAAVAFLLAIPACDQGASDKQTIDTPAPVAAATPTRTIQPWETFDPAFNMCAGGCGMRMAGPTEGVSAQPGAMLGQTTYCLVSGVAFEIKVTSVQRKVGDKLLYFCCEACAQYFQAHQAQILAARGIT